MTESVLILYTDTTHVDVSFTLPVFMPIGTLKTSCRVLKQQNNEGELSSLCGTNILFFNFLPQGPKLCPLGVLLNPVFFLFFLKTASSCELKANLALANFLFRRAEKLSFQLTGLQGRHRETSRVSLAAVGRVGVWRINHVLLIYGYLQYASAPNNIPH